MCTIAARSASRQTGSYRYHMKSCAHRSPQGLTGKKGEQEEFAVLCLRYGTCVRMARAKSGIVPAKKRPTGTVLYAPLARDVKSQPLALGQQRLIVLVIGYGIYGSDNIGVGS
ncbi:expressed unknown protein [Seminavis robusta]|uniref:Uncharacterized protein n=1 Tax=Seminavis robusta TaxID=568900 RepID=A0A9N8DFN8_9STRA|nr:expressed unknown protein [Seminavis robusta]|eukprot:Sro66_g037191.1  (113) ;mRNA; f:71859-72197